MEIGIVGLGRMGGNMVSRLLRKGHRVIAYNRSPGPVKEKEAEGAIGSYAMDEFVAKFEAHPRVMWLMLPAGAVVDEHLETLLGLLSKGDIVIDGGNSFYKDDLRRAEKLLTEGISFMDAGVSGGIWGLKIGYCTMMGGDLELFRQVEPLLKTLAPQDGYLHCGGVGAGHFVKMVHNGIEYGMMQAYAEGFEIIQASPYKTNLKDVAHLWNQGSVVRSWLLELAEDAFAKDANLDQLEGYVDDSGEGRWTVQQAVESGVAAPVIALSLFQRFISRDKNSFSFRVLAALRNEFGGHAVVKAKKE